MAAQPGAEFEAAIRQAVRAELGRQGQAADKARARQAAMGMDRITKFVGPTGTRTLRGRCSAPTTDRDGDVLDPAGARWHSLPIPMLWQHSHQHPVGLVRSIERRADGLWIEAEVATGIAKADEVWQMVSAGLLRDYSVGFIGKKSEALATGGRRFTEYEILEISIVTIGSNRDSKIERSARPFNHGVKLIDNSGTVPLITKR